MKTFFIENTYTFDATGLDALNDYIADGGGVDQIIPTSHGLFIAAYSKDEENRFTDRNENSIECNWCDTEKYSDDTIKSNREQAQRLIRADDFSVFYHGDMNKECMYSPQGDGITRTTITRRFEWDMGHRVTNHDSKCRNLHGHRYVANFTMEAPLVNNPTASDHGMVMDFGEVKSLLGEMIEELDHGFMVWDADTFQKLLVSTGTKIITVPFVPTAENISQMLLERSTKILRAKGISVTSVEVWETPNCAAKSTV